MKELIRKVLMVQLKLWAICVVLILFLCTSMWGGLLPNTGVIPVYLIYPIYAVSFLTLLLFSWSIIFCVKRGSLKNIQRRLGACHPICTNFFYDSSFRLTIGMYSSFFLNSILALWRGWTGVVSSSLWFVLLGCYYLVAAIIRFLLLKSQDRRKNLEKNEQSAYGWRTYRWIGIFTLVITLVLQLTVSHIVMTGGGYFYEGVWIYAVAFYDFFYFVKEVIQLIKVRKTSDPILKATKVIRFLTAMGAMLALQTAMFASFGAETEQSFKQLMNALSGTAICLISSFIGIRMIIVGTKELAKARNG